jgi:hypothetical protein
MVYIFKDLIHEANEELLKLRPTDPKVIADIFEDRSTQWGQICYKLKEYNLNPWGFKLMFRKLSPAIYAAMVVNGMTDIPKELDAELNPPKPKRHKKSKGDNHNDGTIH